MKLSSIVALVLVWGVSGCGMMHAEHKRLVQQHLDRQKVAHDTEMQALRTTCSAEVESSVERMALIELQLKALGLDVDLTKGELGGQLKDTIAELEQVRKQRAQAEKDATAFRALNEKLKAMIDAGKVQVVMRNGRMTLKLPDAILFPAGSKKLLKEGTETLVSVIGVLDGVEGRDFLVAGHTDNVPVGKGSGFRSNWDLSTARAVEVVNVMVSSGIAPQRLAAAGYGEFDPVADNSTPEGRAQNRRLEIILMPRIEDIAAAQL